MRMRVRVGPWALGVALVALLPGAREAQAQSGPGSEAVEDEASPENPRMKEPQNTTLPASTPASTARRRPGIFADLLGDQKDLWSSPTKLRFSDSVWLVPAAGITTGLFLTDAQYSRHLPSDAQTTSHYNTLSAAGVAGLAGGAGAMWLLSYHNHNQHWRETGLLAARAAVNSLVMTETLKYSLGRSRPYEGNGNGAFFQGGTSFPSEHTAAAWSIASVVAHEYPGPMTKLLAYGAAALVSYSRVRARDHFPSDVFVGALVGELAAHQAYSRYHDPELGGDPWPGWGEHARSLYRDPVAANLGSPYVPLDSWVYPALERLMAMRFIDSGFLGLRPWTRRECARLVADADERASGAPEAAALLRRLEAEFQGDLEAPSARTRTELESLYARVTTISGAPLNSGLDFAQSIVNDYGRPFARGANAVSGFSFWITSGPWVGYLRGEYQYAPSSPALPPAAREFVSSSQFLGSFAGQFPGAVGPGPGTPTPAVSRFTLLDAYVGTAFSNWQFTFGNQSLWWGPAEGGATLVSTNSAPIPMLRLSRVTPFTLPLISRVLGPMRVELFLGQLSGQSFVNGPQGIEGSYSVPLRDQPFIHGQKISLKPTRNFEFSLSRTTLTGGPGVPITLGTLRRSLLSTSNALPGTPSDPGDRRSAVDWTYRLPKLRRWVTFYGDAFTDDQFTPIVYADRSAFSAGLYLPQLPKIPKLDFRVEGIYTDVPAGGALSHGFFYFNSRFLNGYTNDGNLIGSWIGREGQGAQAWANYWFSPRTRLQLTFRHQKVSQQFVPGGGSLTDFGARTDFTLRRDFDLTVSVGYERWLFPIIQPNASRNVSASIGVVFTPQRILQKAWSMGDPLREDAP
jgi:membrane-associated phospholipid phosphatase